VATKNRNDALEYLKSVKPRSSSHKILSQDDYLNGIVANVEYMDNSETVRQWIVVTKTHKGYADSESQLIQLMQSASNSHAGARSLTNKLFNLTGVIALVLVGAFVYLSIMTQDGNVPEALKAMVLTVVGFYFGGVTKRVISKEPT
jgi:hypothetical protein